MTELVSIEALAAFVKVVAIDLMLASDNAIIIGLAAAGLAREQRTKAIVTGIVAAMMLRMALAGITTQLLKVDGFLLAGGLLLLWVCWKMWREIREWSRAAQAAAENGLANPGPGGVAPRKTLFQAALQIVVSDVSLSTDNILAVAGAAREYPIVLVFGLALSMSLVGVAASFLAGLLHRHHWIAYFGLAMVLYVALDMVFGSLSGML